MRLRRRERLEAAALSGVMLVMPGVEVGEGCCVVGDVWGHDPEILQAQRAEVAGACAQRNVASRFSCLGLRYGGDRNP